MLKETSQVQLQVLCVDNRRTGAAIYEVCKEYGMSKFGGGGDRSGIPSGTR